eukprot:6187920-Pleurochrysis_carterae.AAC.2
MLSMATPMSSVRSVARASLYEAMSSHKSASAHPDSRPASHSRLSRTNEVAQVEKMSPAPRQTYGAPQPMPDADRLAPSRSAYAAQERPKA